MPPHFSAFSNAVRRGKTIAEGNQTKFSLRAHLLLICVAWCYILLLAPGTLPGTDRYGGLHGASVLPRASQESVGVPPNVVTSRRLQHQRAFRGNYRLDDCRDGQTTPPVCGLAVGGGSYRLILKRHVWKFHVNFTLSA